MALPPPAPASTCLVTGASSGIGAAIARELAQRGYGVTLVARREERLRDLAAELEEAHAVRVEVVPGDLADPTARDLLAEEVEDRGLAVEVLVNNAGYGSAGNFHELDREREVEMVRLNCEAVVDICGRYLPGMVERGRGAVLTVASVAGFQPVPRQATYAATKAFALSFTESLHAEASTSGVTVTAVCPGPVRSEFIDVAGMEEMHSTPNFVWMSAEATARAAVRGLERGKRVVVPGATNQAAALVGHHAPRGLLLAGMRRFYPPGR